MSPRKTAVPTNAAERVIAETGLALHADRSAKDFAAMLGLPRRTVSEVTEQFLQRAGLIVKDDQGRRQLTAKGRDHLSASNDVFEEAHK